MSVKETVDIQTVLFPVAQLPVYIPVEEELQQKSIFENQNINSNIGYRKIPHFKAIVDVKKNYVFAVVAENYRLVTNMEAIKMGEVCFCKVFDVATAEKMKVYNIIMPKTRSFCHIDYTYENYTFEPWKGDLWYPFLRITNSYNRTKLLRFDLGFCRDICTNGMIFGERSVSFRYLHTKGDVGRTVEFNTSLNELKELEKRFIERVHNLKRYYIPSELMFPLLCSVFNIKFEKKELKRPNRLLQLQIFKNHVDELTNKYFEEIGPNGYAALSVITDFASRPKLYISAESMVDHLQKRSGDWVSAFLKEMQNPNFSFENYLIDYTEQAKLLDLETG